MGSPELNPTDTPEYEYVSKKQLQQSDINKIISLRINNNLSIYNIAPIIGCHPATVYRHLRNNDKTQQKLERYKKNRADDFAYEQMQETAILNAIKEDLMTQTHDGTPRILQLSEPQKKGWYDSISVSRGITYDKERLERGQGTNNQAILIDTISKIKALEDDNTS